MHSSLYLLAATTLPFLTSATKTTPPSLQVPACPQKSTIQYNKAMPEPLDFPLTKVSLCYSPSSLHLIFSAYNETDFYYNTTYTTNDPIYEYEVMETFISHGRNDPQTYLEFEIAPNNVTFNAFIYNPSKVREEGRAFDTMYLQTPVEDGIVGSTVLNKEQGTWISDVEIPLGLFNVDEGEGKGTEWRMNFFRTVVKPETFPDQLLGAWSPTDAANFHKTPFFGYVEFA